MEGDGKEELIIDLKCSGRTETKESVFPVLMADVAQTVRVPYGVTKSLVCPLLNFFNHKQTNEHPTQ